MKFVLTVKEIRDLFPSNSTLLFECECETDNIEEAKVELLNQLDNPPFKLTRVEELMQEGIKEEYQTPEGVTQPYFSRSYNSSYPMPWGNPNWKRKDLGTHAQVFITAGV